MKLSFALVAFVLTFGAHARPALEARQTQSNSGGGAPTKQITHFPGQLITYTSTLSVTEVLSRLDTQLNKTAGGVDTLHSLVGQAQTRSELVTSMESLYGSQDFLWFSQWDFDPFLKIYLNLTSTTSRRETAYTLGNPIIASQIMQYGLAGGLSIPPRILILENENAAGTQIIYHLCSSVILTYGNQAMLAQVQALDAKLEKLIVGVLTP